MKKRKKRKYSLRVFILMALIGACSYKAIDVYQHDARLHKKRQLLEEKLEQEQEIQKELLSQKEKVNTDEYYETYARENLGLVKPGEIIFVDKGRVGYVNP